MKKIFGLLVALVVGVGTTNAITVRLDATSCANWSTVYLWAWTSQGSVFDMNWPGQVINQDADGWYSYTFDDNLFTVSIIWTDGTNQTVDINGVTQSTCYSLNSTTGTAITVSTVDCPSEPETYERVLIGDLYYNLDATNHTAEVTYDRLWSESNYSGLTAISIPSSVNYKSVSYNVTSIGEHAFYDCSHLETVNIPNGVTIIRYQSFQYCYGLTNVIIPNSVTIIGYEAFEYCSGLTNITIPNSVTNIEGYAFSKCSGLNSITIPNSVTSIGHDAFSSCTSLSSITISNSVTSIGDGAFLGCASLTSINLPNGVTSIGGSAFAGCTSITSMVIPKSVLNIGGNIFQGCDNLINIVVENGNPKYDSRNNCNAIIETSTNTLVSGCSNTLIPSSVKIIGPYAFCGCKNTAISLPEGVTKIAERAFAECVNLTSILIPHSVTSIGLFAFLECVNLESIFIPNGVSNIEGSSNILFGCYNLSSIVVENGNPRYDSRNNCNALIETATNTLKSGCKNTIIPNGIAIIEEGAFGMCHPLSSIAIPSSVTSIADFAFEQCENLRSIYCKALIPPTFQGEYPFGIIGLTLPYVDSLYVAKKSLSAYQTSNWAPFFANIYGLSCTVTFKDADGNIIETQDVYPGEAAISPQAPEVFGYLFVGWDKDFSQVTEDMTVTAIYRKLPIVIFYDMYGNEIRTQIANAEGTVIAPPTPDVFGYTFVGWDHELTNITEDITITAIYQRDAVNGFYYIYDRDAKTAVLDHEGDSYANIRKLNVPNNFIYRGIKFAVVAVGANAFENCDRLTEVVLPGNVENVEEYAFSGCGDMIHLTMSANLRSIADYAFNGCKRLEDITVYAERVPDLTATSFNAVGNKKYIKVYVPDNRVNNYKRDDYWSEFNIVVKSADIVEGRVDDVAVEPDETTAQFTWPTSSSAGSYTIEITKAGEVVCTLIFNANGQLSGIAFAPGRNGNNAPAAALTNNGGMQFTVTGLDAGTSYAYTVTMKDTKDRVMAKYEGSFETSGRMDEGIVAIDANTAPQKILHNGQIYILRGEKVFTLQGVEVK